MMSAEEILAEQTEDEPAADGLNEVVQVLTPYLQDKNKVSEFTETLKGLGIETLSDIAHLKQTDVPNFITVIRFREMEGVLQANKAKKQPAGGKNKKDDGYVFDLASLLNSDSLKKKLEADDELLLSTERSDIIHTVATDIRDHHSVICEKKVLNICKSIILASPTSLGCLKKDDLDIGEAAAVLCRSVLGHIRYIQALERERKRKTLNESDKNKKRKKSDNFTRAQNFGLDPERDLPTSFPTGESRETQESKRVVLHGMYSSGQRDMPVVMKNMMDCYASIRIDVNKKLRIEPLLERWPFIGMYPVMESHFEYLMASNVSELLQAFNIKFESMERFVEATSHRKSKGKKGSREIAEGLKEEIITFRKLGQNMTNDHKFLFMIRCAIICMKSKLDSLFVHFEEETSYDEVQASSDFPNDGRPIVAVLGKNPYAQETKAFVVIENRCIAVTTLPVHKAILLAYMCYFTLKISYPRAAAPILYFLQSRVFKIKGEGSKTRREKKPDGSYSVNPPPKPEKYLTFMRDYKSYCLSYNVEA